MPLSPGPRGRLAGSREPCHGHPMARSETAGRRRERGMWKRLSGDFGIAVLVIVPQLPAVVALAALTGRWLLVAAGPALLSAAFFAGRTGYRFRPRGRLHLYAGLWPFFAWWATCATFLALAPLALLASLIPAVGLIPALATAGALSAAYGLAAVRRTPRITRVALWSPALPAALDGYRIAQLSDIHCGLFAPEHRVRDWVRRANALDADLIAVTGDLIASGTDHIEPVARALGELRAADGVYAVMGNHDYFGAGESLVWALRDRGVAVLRNDHRLVRSGLVLAGVDDTWSRRANLERALAGAPGGAFTLLLAHDPDMFPHAAGRGVALTLAGHTHGGQFAVPLLARRYNLANLVTRYTSGLYREGEATLFVNRGVGTSGPPIRLGTRGEIVEITLRRGRGRSRRA
jgi:uncharacterized protein